MVDIDFSISSYCNAACPSCKRYASYNEPDIFDKDVNSNLNQVHMKFDDFYMIMNRDNKFFRNKTVSYEGEFGDPMVNPEVFKFIEYGSELFEHVKVFTNGSVRRPEFYQKIGNTFSNVLFVFSIDGMDDDTNTIYRRRVNTKKSFDNMISFKDTKYGEKNLSWQYLIFEHNYFEIRDVLAFSKVYEIPVTLKINNRPKFKLKKYRIDTVIDEYEKYKHSRSKLELGN